MPPASGFSSPTQEWKRGGGARERGGGARGRGGGARELAPWLRALAVLSDNLGSFLSTYLVVTSAHNTNLSESNIAF